MCAFLRQECVFDQTSESSVRTHVSRRSSVKKLLGSFFGMFLGHIIVDKPENRYSFLPGGYAVWYASPLFAAQCTTTDFG